MAKLELRKLRLVSKLDVADRPITIGRASTNDVVLANTHVSRKHCVIEALNGSVQIRDLQSHGGTFVNGAQITETTLVHGDRISVGPFDLLFHDPVNSTTVRGLAPPAPDKQAAAAVAARDELQAQLDAERLVRIADAQRITALAAQLEAAQRKLDESGNGSDKAQKERETLQDQLNRAQSALGDARQQIAAANHEATLNANRFDELTNANKSLQGRLDQLESERRNEIEKYQQELSKAHLEIERLQTHEATLQEQADALNAARHAAAQKAEQAEHALRTLRHQAHSLDEAARKVASLQDRLAEIESAWVQVNQQMEEAENGDPESLEAAALERHRFSSELDELNQLRDHALQTLNESAQQMRALSERHSVPLIAEVAGAGAGAGEATRTERRWWKFGR